MTPGTTNHGADDAQAAWSLAQIARLADAAIERGQRVRDRLDGFRPEELHAAGGAEMDADRLHAVLEDVSTLRETAEQMDMIGASSTAGDRTLDAKLDEIAEAAADTLMEGGSDLCIVELAVRLLDRERGFPALASAIELDPLAALAGWGETTVGDLLNAFHDSEVGRTAALCAAAGVTEEARWTSLGVDALLGVCAALRVAGSQP